MMEYKYVVVPDVSSGAFNARLQEVCVERWEVMNVQWFDLPEPVTEGLAPSGMIVFLRRDEGDISYSTTEFPASEDLSGREES